MGAPSPSTTVERPTYETISVGDSYVDYRFLSAEDVRIFGGVTGDTNPIHTDSEYAQQTRFGERVVHGVFLLSLFSKVIGCHFPGPGSVAVKISCRFLRPVAVNTTVRVEVIISEKLEKRRHIIARTLVYNEDNKICGAGEVTFIPPGEEDRV